MTNWGQRAKVNVTFVKFTFHLHMVSSSATLGGKPLPFRLENLITGLAYFSQSIQATMLTRLK